jgi:hypothetical protein
MLNYQRVICVFLLNLGGILHFQSDPKIGSLENPKKNFHILIVSRIIWLVYPSLPLSFSDRLKHDSSLYPISLPSGKLTQLEHQQKMAMFNSYVKLPEVKYPRGIISLLIVFTRLLLKCPIVRQPTHSYCF